MCMGRCISRFAEEYQAFGTRSWYPYAHLDIHLPMHIETKWQHCSCSAMKDKVCGCSRFSWTAGRRPVLIPQANNTVHPRAWSCCMNCFMMTVVESKVPPQCTSVCGNVWRFIRILNINRKFRLLKRSFIPALISNVPPNSNLPPRRRKGMALPLSDLRVFGAVVDGEHFHR